MTIRLVAIDVDGTLLTSDHRITEVTAVAVDRARRVGIEVGLATGRPPRALNPVADRLGLCDGSALQASQGALTATTAPALCGSSTRSRCPWTSPSRPLQRPGSRV